MDLFNKKPEVCTFQAQIIWFHLGKIVKINVYLQKQTDIWLDPRVKEGVNCKGTWGNFSEISTFDSACTDA